MENKYNRETSHLILTSKSWDRIWGMGAFHDVTVISSSTTKSSIRQNIKNSVDTRIREWIIRQVPEDDYFRNNILKNTIFIPTIGFSKKKILGPGSFSLEMEVVLAGALVIYCQSEKILIPGNIIQSFMLSFIWPINGVELYRKWERLDIEYILPGRGPVIKKKYLVKLKTWMEDHICKLREYRDQNIPESQILKKNSLITQEKRDFHG